MCSGKIYFDLLEAREKSKNDKCVLTRIEQLYPFPAKTLAKIFMQGTLHNPMCRFWTIIETQKCLSISIYAV